MKIKKGILGLLALAGVLSLASCGGEAGGNPSKVPTIPPTVADPTTDTTTETVPTFEDYTLEQLHAARKAKTLASLDKKYVKIKGKVTYAKRANENNASFFIQSGKFGLEVDYPDTYTVNVGDSVEIKGLFGAFKLTSDVDSIKLYVDKPTSSYFDVKVINEAITVEDVTINSLADLIEYDSSKAVIDFDVTGNRTNAAFVGKLLQGNEQIIVAPKSSLGGKFDGQPFNVGDRVRYTGVFTYTGNEDTKVLRYYGETSAFSVAN